MTQSLQFKHPIDSASEVLRRNIQKILEKWAYRVRKEVPAAFKQSESVLYDRLPNFLNSLADHLSVTSDGLESERIIHENIENSRRHGAERARISEYTLDQVIQEHRVLRQITFEFLERHSRLTLIERDKLLDAIDGGITNAATEFAALRGFPDARIQRAEDDKKQVQLKLNESNTLVNTLENERAMREKFVSTLTHDLRTPLTFVKMNAELILKKLDDPQTCSRLARKIIEGVQRIDQMIRDLLDASRIRAGESLTLTFEEVDYAKLVRDTLQDLAAIHGERFILNSDSVVMGFCSPSDIRRVIENLANNALQYGDSQTPVTIKLESSGDQIILSVHNEGNPIPQEAQDGLFKQFCRLRTANKSTQKGWGLGLTLVRGITQSHGGNVIVESTPEDGTTFKVILPKDPRSKNGVAKSFH